MRTYDRRGVLVLAGLAAAVGACVDDEESGDESAADPSAAITITTVGLKGTTTEPMQVSVDGQADSDGSDDQILTCASLCTCCGTRKNCFE